MYGSEGTVGVYYSNAQGIRLRYTHLMATDFSRAYVEASKKRLRFSSLWFQMKFWRFIKKWRMVRRYFASKKIHSSLAPCALTAQFDAAADHFQKHTWAFVEEVLSSDFLDELCSNWPKKF